MRWRWRCRLWGCYLADREPVCERCGEWLYGGLFLDHGPLARLVGAWQAVRLGLRSWRERLRCQQCGRTSLGRYQRDTGFCSAACHDDWIPF